jgi:phosphate transport system substrate-binding protein
MFSRKLLIALLTIAIIGTTAIVPGCTSPTPTPTGSPTATLAPLAGTIKVVGSTSVQPYATDLSDNFTEKYPNAMVQVSGGGSGAGIKATQDGTAKIGMSSRELSRAEKDSGLKEIVIAYDGIVIIVNKANTAVSDLSTQQIRDIFAGNITNWKDVGGSDASINVVTREAASGTRTAFQELVMLNKVNITNKAVVQGSTGAITQTVTGDRNAIGYISYGSLDNTVKALKVGGIAPSINTIKDKTYVIQRPFLYVTKGDVTDPVAKAFIEYTLSPEGQAILASGKLVTV